MVRIEFDKYQGTGNDFIMLNNMDGRYDLRLETIRFLCDRKFGIGADGLIKLSPHNYLDFEVDYYNSDGSQSFCGNGARCSILFAMDQGIKEGEVNFMAIDGEHTGCVDGDQILLKMNDVENVVSYNSDFIVDTGSPHYIHLVEADIDIVKYGKEIRYSDNFRKSGINVNSLRISGGELYLQTYERGVEDETLSCGTGVVAAALTAMRLRDEISDNVYVNTKGGRLNVSATEIKEGFNNIWLNGPAKKVYSGVVEL